MIPKGLWFYLDFYFYWLHFSSSDRQVSQLQFQVDKMKEENFALESGNYSNNSIKYNVKFVKFEIKPCLDML